MFPPGLLRPTWRGARRHLALFGALALGLASLVRPARAQTTVTYPNGQNNGTAYDSTGNALTLQVNASDAATQSGVISGTGAVTKTGTGLLTLSGNNTFSGGTALNAGTLVLTNDDALGSGSLAINGGTLQGSGATHFISNPVAINSSFTIGRGLFFLGGLTLNSDVTLTGTSAGGTGDTVIGSAISGAHSVTIAEDAGGMGTASIIFNAANSYSGGTTISSGRVKLSSGGNLGSGAVVINGGELVASSSATLGSLSGTGGTITMTSGAGFTTFNQTVDGTYAGTITGAGPLRKSGSATLTLTGTNTFSGNVTLTAGNLALGSAGALGSGSGAIIFNGGTLQYTAANTTDYSARFATSVNQSYRIDTNGQNVTFASALTSATGSLVKSGAGTLTLSGANSYGGNTTVSAGTLQFAQPAALYNNVTTNWTAAKFSVASGATAAFNVGGTGEFTAADLDIIKGLGTTLGGFASGSALGLDTSHASGGSFAYASNIANPRSGANALGLTKLGSGTLVLSGVNTYTGPTTIAAGTLGFATQTALYNNTPASWTAANLVVNSGTIATFNVGGTGEFTAGNLDTLRGNGVFGSGTTLGLDTTNAGGTFTYSSGMTGSHGLVKLGTGTLALTGANTFTGGTTISAGTLQLGAGSTSGSLAGDVTNNSTLAFNRSDALTFSGTISGSGSVTQLGAGNVTLTGTNTYTGGTTVSAGTLTLGSAAGVGSGSVSIASGATFNAAGYGFDVSRLAGSGTATSTGTFSYNSAGDFTLPTVLAGSASLTKSGSGTLTLSGVNTYGGTTTISGGTLAIGSGGRLAVSTTYIDNNATLDLGGTTTAVVPDLGAFDHRIVGNITNGAITTPGYIVLQSGTFDATFNGTGGNARLWIGGDASSTVTLNGANNVAFTFDHNGVVIGYAATGAAGTVKLGNANALMPATETAQVISGTLDLNGISNVRGAGIQLLGGSASSLVNNNTASVASFGGSGTVAGGAAQMGGAGDLVFGGPINGNGSLNKIGAGSLTLSVNNSYTGGTVLNAGTLLVGADGALGYSGSFLTINGGTLGATNGAHNLFNPVNLNGSFTLGRDLNLLGMLLVNNSLTITNANPAPAGGASTRLSGSFYGSGTVTLTAGTNPSDILYLSGQSSGTFGGTFDIAGGNVTVTGSFGRNGTLLVHNGATLDLTGTFQQINGLGTAANPVAGNIVGGTIHTNNNPVYLQSGTFSNTFSGTSVARLWIGGDANATVTLNGTNDNVYTQDHNQVLIGHDTTGAAGTVRIGNANALMRETENALVFSGTLDLNGVSSVRGASIQLHSGAASALVNNNTSAPASFANTLLLVSPGSVLGGAGDLTLSGAIIGGGGFTKTGGGTLTISGPSYYGGETTVSGGTLKLGASNSLPTAGAVTLNGGTLDVGAFNQTIGAFSLSSGALTGTGTLTASSFAFSNSNQFTVATPLGGSGSLTKTGTGVLQLSGANSYTGGTIISQGTLRMGATNTLPAGGAVTVNGGSLAIAGFAQTIGAFSLSSGTLTGSNWLTASSFEFSNNSNLDILSVTLAGSGGLTKTGTGTLALYAGATYTGNTIISQGTLSLGAGNALSRSSAVIVDGGTLAIGSGSGNQSVQAFSLSSGALTGTAILSATSFAFSNASLINIGTRLGGTGAVTKTGAGQLTLFGTNSYTGGTYINGGAISVSADANLGAAAGNVSLAGGTLAATASFTATRATTLGAGGGIFDIASGSTLTWNGAITGAAGNDLTKIGAGTLVLGGTNSYSGDTLVNAGTLRLGAASGLSPNTTLFVAPGATFDPAGFAPTFGALSGTGTIDTGSGGLGVAPSGTNTFTGTLTGSGGLTMSGTGTLVLGNANTFSGNTAIASGTLRLGAAGALPGGTPVSLTSGGTLDLNGYAATLGSLSGASGTTVALTGASLAVAQSGNTTFAGALTGSGGLVKSGAGTLTLSGSNSFTGATTINAGRIVLNGAAAGSAFTINSGGVLSGSGTVGTLTIASGGTLSPGNSPGTLHDSGGATFAGGGNLVWEINKTSGAAGSNPGWDLLSISGALAINATSGNRFNLHLISLTLGDAAGLVGDFNSASNYAFTFVTAGSITGFDASAFYLDTGGFQNPFTGTWSVTQSGNSLLLSYTAAAGGGGGGAVPEPSTYALWAGAAALALAGWRRAARGART